MEYSLAVVGPVGAGKSTLVELLAERKSRDVIEEPWQDNPYIKRLPENVFSCQWKMFSLMADCHRKLKVNRNSILDRTFYEVFGVFTRQLKGYLTPEEYEALQMANRQLEGSIYTPDVIIYLRCPAAIAWQRIVKRGRAFEIEKYGLDYCEDQSFLYEGLYGYLKPKTYVIDVSAEQSKDQILSECIRKLGAFERNHKPMDISAAIQKHNERISKKT
ncbi:putative deoxynucleoside kinase [Acaryochloris phage A-HIS1]|nr:putative deoxynucleoside kinase [Acaryochloris phage A-HIS1]